MRLRNGEWDDETRNLLIIPVLVFGWCTIALPQTALQGGDNIYNAFVIPEPNFSDSGTTPGFAITGNVTESGDGPLSGANIRVLHDGSQVWQDTTDASGNYYVIYLAPGVYVVEASKSEYITQTSEPVVVATCEHARVDFALAPIPPPPIGTISGIVFEADGATPIDGVLIRASQEGSEIFRDTTGSDGLFILPEMQLGLYDIEASKIGYATQTQHDIEVFADQSTWVVFELQWQPQCVYIPGDVNGRQGGFTGLDVVYAVTYLKYQTPPPAYSCECTSGHTWYVAGDVNGSCSFTGLDVSYMVNYLGGGLALRPCPDCPPPGR